MLLTGETEVLGEKHYTASVVVELMIMEHWWSDTDRGNRIIRENPRPSALHKSRKDWPGIDPVPSR